MEVTAITVVVPMTTPSTVRKERNLCVRSVSSASRRFSRTWWRAAISILHAQRLDGVEAGGFAGGIDSEKQAHRGRQSHAHNHGAQGNRRGEKPIHDVSNQR